MEQKLLLRFCDTPTKLSGVVIVFSSRKFIKTMTQPKTWPLDSAFILYIPKPKRITTGLIGFIPHQLPSVTSIIETVIDKINVGAEFLEEYHMERKKYLGTHCVTLREGKDL